LAEAGLQIKTGYFISIERSIDTYLTYYVGDSCWSTQITEAKVYLTQSDALNQVCDMLACIRFNPLIDDLNVIELDYLVSLDKSSGEQINLFL
jgi:hypothetical protein